MTLGSLYNTAWHPLSFGLKNMYLNKQSFLVVILKRREKNLSPDFIIGVFFKFLWFGNVWIAFLF